MLHQLDHIIEENHQELKVFYEYEDLLNKLNYQ